MNSTDSSSDDSLSDEELRYVIERRDSYQTLKEKIETEVLDKRKFTIERYSNWRLSLANISYAIAIAIVPLMFFTDKRPHHPLFFYLGVVVLLFNGAVSYVREKNDIETDMNQLPHTDKKQIFGLTVFVNLLNQTIHYQTKAKLLEYFEKSNTIAAETEKEITEDAKNKRAKVSVWNEAHFLLPILGAIFLAREVLNSYLFWIILALFVIGSLIYARKEYNKAQKEQEKAIDWDKKIVAERKLYSDWWQNILEGKEDQPQASRDT